MSGQEEGLVGRLVGAMIRRSTKSRLRNLWWRPSPSPLTGPVIFYANHHGWLDGYLMFHVVTKLGLRSLDWIEEFDAFPLFAKVGGMRYARGDAAGRALTVRRTIRLMKEQQRSLVLFPEGVLHRPGSLLPFGRALEVVARKVPAVKLVPAAIYYEQSMHERPEAWVSLGEPHDFQSLDDCQDRLGIQLDLLRHQVQSDHGFELLALGTKSINERHDMRKYRR